MKLVNVFCTEIDYIRSVKIVLIFSLRILKGITHEI